MTTKQRILTAAIATGIEVNLILFGPAMAKAEAFPLPAGPFPMSPSDPSPPSPPSDTGSSMSSIEIPSAPAPPSIEAPQIPSLNTGPSAQQNLPGGPPPNRRPAGGP